MRLLSSHPWTPPWPLLLPHAPPHYHPWLQPRLHSRSLAMCGDGSSADSDSALPGGDSAGFSTRSTAAQGLAAADAHFAQGAESRRLRLDSELASLGAQPPFLPYVAHPFFPHLRIWFVFSECLPSLGAQPQMITLMMITLMMITLMRLTSPTRRIRNASARILTPRVRTLITIHPHHHPSESSPVGVDLDTLLSEPSFRGSAAPRMYSSFVIPKSAGALAAAEAPQRAAVVASSIAFAVREQKAAAAQWLLNHDRALGELGEQYSRRLLCGYLRRLVCAYDTLENLPKLAREQKETS